MRSRWERANVLLVDIGHFILIIIHRGGAINIVANENSNNDIIFLNIDKLICVWERWCVYVCTLDYVSFTLVHYDVSMVTFLLINEPYPCPRKMFLIMYPNIHTIKRKTLIWRVFFSYNLIVSCVCTLNNLLKYFARKGKCF